MWPQAFTSNGYNIYTSSLANNHEFGTAFLTFFKDFLNTFSFCMFFEKAAQNTLTKLS
jgi:hypothetical protein